MKITVIAVIAVISLISTKKALADISRISCAIPPQIVDVYPSGSDASLVFDEDLASGIDLQVMPGDRAHLIADYGCNFQFHNFQFRNMLTNQWSFGVVLIYTSPTQYGPFSLIKILDKGSALYDGGFNWYTEIEARSRFVMYEFANTTQCSQTMVISDIETAATYLP